MAYPSVTYNFSNGSVSDADQVDQNFQDLINGFSDGTKDFSMLNGTLSGNLIVSGNTTLGNATGDDVTVTGSLASSIPIKTTNTYDIGSSTLGLRALYFGANSQTVNIVGSGSMSATWTFTMPVTAGTANYVLETNGSGVTSWTKKRTSFGSIENCSISCSVGSSALTITLASADGTAFSSTNYGTIPFRSATLTTGTLTDRQITSNLTLTISSGSTLGHVSAVNNNIYVYAIDNAGTVELAASSALFKHTSLVTTTAEGGAGAADSNRVMYSTTARTSVAARLIAVLISNQTAAGTYAAVPTDIQLVTDPAFVRPQVAVKYSTNAGQSIANNSSTTIDFEDKVFSSNGCQGAVTTGGSWVFTAPIAGTYLVCASAYFTTGGGWAAGEYAVLRVFKNGSNYGNLFELDMQAAHTSGVGTGGAEVVQCAAGDTIAIQILHNSGAALALEADGSYNFVSISFLDWSA